MFVVLVFVCGAHGIRHECKSMVSVAGLVLYFKYSSF